MLLFLNYHSKTIARIPNPPRAWLRPYPTCELRGTSKPTRRVCVWYARGFLIDGLPFQLLTSLKLALSDGPQCRLKVSNLTKLKP